MHEFCLILLRLIENKELLLDRKDSDEDIYPRFRFLIGRSTTWSIPFAQVRQDARAYSPEAIEEFRKGFS